MGEPVVFRFENDGELQVSSLAEALKVLRERFGWKGEQEAAWGGDAAPSSSQEREDAHGSGPS